MTNWTCNYCWKEIRKRISLCKECNNILSHNKAIISQNKKKLRKLLEEKSVTIERLDKFILYSSNVVNCWKVLIKFREKDIKRSFDRITKFSLTCFFVIIIGIILI